MSAHLRRWLIVVVLLAVAGCGATQASTRQAHTGAAPASVPGLPAQLRQVTFDPSPWRTDFARHSVSLTSILPGGPPPDGIPPIDHPRYTSIAQPARFLAPREPVIAVQVNGQARAYPIQILIWHEIVNDTLGGMPIAVTYCPLCNSALVFDRRAGGRRLTFGTTGNLRNSDLVMWDRQTQSWWQQFSGQAIVGTLTGARLTALDSQTLSFADFRNRYPTGDVLSRDTGFQRPYGQNPYEGYDTDPSSRPFDYGGRLDPRLPPVERVESITLANDTVVVPFSALARHAVIPVTVDRVRAVVLFDPRVLSPLDELNIANSRQVGTAVAFDRRLGGRTLDFRTSGSGLMTDAQTASTWDITGRAIAGPLRGAQLRRLHDLNAFWFAVAAFLPHARLVTVGSGG
jgi:uncharacterized protein DUF3179